MYVCMYTHVHCSYNNWEIGCRFPANLLPRLLPKQCWPHFEAWGVHPWSKRGFGALVVAPMQAVLDFIYSDKLEIEVHRLAIATGDGPRQLLLQNGFKLYEHSRMVLWACLDSPLMNHTTCGWQPNGHAKPLPTIGKPLKTMLFAVWFWLGPFCKMVLPVGISHLGWNHVHTFCHFCLCG